MHDKIDPRRVILIFTCLYVVMFLSSTSKSIFKQSNRPETYWLLSFWKFLFYFVNLDYGFEAMNGFTKRHALLVRIKMLEVLLCYGLKVLFLFSGPFCISAICWHQDSAIPTHGKAIKLCCFKFRSELCFSCSFLGLWFYLLFLTIIFYRYYLNSCKFKLLPRWAVQ